MQSAEEFKKSGNIKFGEKDYEGAIADYTTAIIKNPNVGSFGWVNAGYLDNDFALGT
jgi:hypothetical protein